MPEPSKPKRTERQNQPHPDEEAQVSGGILPCPVVGIGASASGLVAFKSFFSHMPIDSGMAFVLVPHLDPTQPDG